jgi:hypothetical protein
VEKTQILKSADKIAEKRLHSLFGGVVTSRFGGRGSFLTILDVAAFLIYVARAIVFPTY